MGDRPRGLERAVGLEALGAALSFVEEIILACREDGTILFVSPSVRTVLGWDPADVVGRNAVEYLQPESIGEMLNSLTRWAGRDGRTRANPLQVRSAFGNYIELDFFVVAGPSVSEMGDFVVTMRPVGSFDEERVQLLLRLANEERLVRLASTFLGLGPEGFDQGLDEAVLQIAGLRWVTRASVWQRVGDELSLRAVWEADDGAPSVPLPKRVALSHVPEAVGGEEVHLRSPTEIVDEATWTSGAKGLVAAGVKELLAVPMRPAGVFVGVVQIEHTFDHASFDTTHFSTLRTAAAILAEAFARNEVERELAARASVDMLTGLPNRWTFQRAIESLLEREVGEGPTGVAVVLFDLDRFKLVNDSFGHEAGDRLLVEVGARLSTAVAADGPDHTVVARLGGDEFLLLVGGCEDHFAAERRVARILSVLDAPFEVNGQPVQLTASAGLAYVDGAVTGPTDLMRQADLAMFRVKHGGGASLAMADLSRSTAFSDRLSEEALLRSSIAEGRLETFLQGEWDLASGRLVGAEALARWRHPERGLLTAAEFLPMAEDSDLVLSLGECVLTAACGQLATWRRDGLDDPFVLRVNLSARQLRQPDLLERIEAALDATGLAPDDLCLELTESSLLGDPRAAARTLDQLRAIGCGLAVDDFGTGYSSLLYLRNLPLTCIKIDRVFVAGLPHDRKDRAIVAAIVELAASLGVTVTAEGVETEQQREVLLEIGCECAQGYLLSRPEPMEDFRARLGWAAGAGR